MAQDTERDAATSAQTTTEQTLTLTDATLGVPTAADADDTSDVITIVAQGEPVSYEIAAHGSVEMLGANPREEGVIQSDGVAEGALSTGFVQFLIRGDLGDVTFLTGEAEAYIGTEQIDAVTRTA